MAIDVVIRRRSRGWRANGRRRNRKGGRQHRAGRHQAAQTARRQQLPPAHTHREGRVRAHLGLVDNVAVIVQGGFGIASCGPAPVGASRHPCRAPPSPGGGEFSPASRPAGVLGQSRAAFRALHAKLACRPLPSRCHSQPSAAAPAGVLAGGAPLNCMARLVARWMARWRDLILHGYLLKFRLDFRSS